MALEVQNQQTHPLKKVHGGEFCFSGHKPHGHGVATGSSLTGLRPVTLDLFHTYQPSSHIDINQPCPLLSGWQTFLNLKTTDIHLEDTTMSHRNGPKLDLKLNLSPPRTHLRVESPSRTPSTSPTSSCVSSEINQDETLCYPNSPEATSMMLVGCPRCLMYVMLAEEDPRCPKCKSTVLLDILHENTKRTKKS